MRPRPFVPGEITSAVFFITGWLAVITAVSMAFGAAAGLAAYGVPASILGIIGAAAADEEARVAERREALRRRGEERENAHH